jgi:hypothetical protein
MISTKTNPKGIDEPIQKLQQYLYGKLISAWGLSNEDFKCYGRAYKNDLGNGFIPEVYVGNNEYKEVFLDDTVKVLSFFGVSDERKGKFDFTTEVFLIFFVDISKLKSLQHRADEEVKMDVLKLFEISLFGFELNGFTTAKEQVLKEYTGSRRNDSLKHIDMHPKHCFRLNFSLTYNNKFCNN